MNTSTSPPFRYSDNAASPSSSGFSPAGGAAFEHTWQDFVGVLDAMRSIGTLFVVGPQRSGTTWVQLLLDSHPHCACRFELRLHDAIMGEVHRMIGAYNALITHHSKHVPACAAAESRMHDQTHMMLIMRAMFLAHFFPLPKPGLRYVGEKTPENLLGLHDIELVFPEARYVVVVRDGRDCGLSSWHHFRNSGSPDTSLAAFLKRWVPGHWSPMVNAALDLRQRLPGRSHLVRYEELAARPAETARGIFDFLGIESTSATVAHCVEATSFAAVSGGRPPGDEQPDQFFRKGVAGDWRSAFGAADLAAFSEQGTEINRLLGYVD